MQTQLAIKVGVIFGIALLILIPISMVKSKVYERQLYLEQAKAAVTRSWTGPQLVMTPVIVIPYTQHAVPMKSGFYTDAKGLSEKRNKFLMPARSEIEGVVENRNLHKGIYDIPVYVSRLNLSASFNGERLKNELSRLKETSGVDEVQTPYILLHISDVRGIDSEPLLSVNGEQLTLESGSRLLNLPGGLHSELRSFHTVDKPLELSISLVLRGLESLAFVPLGDYAALSIQSNWPHPEFVGASLPRERSISAEGFNAQWLTTKYANRTQGVFASCAIDGQCDSLLGSSSGVRFIEPVDIYLQSERSIKYAMLFIGLSFISFFVFENIKRVQIHPIQYTFVGLAIAIFYLLLISLAEHLAFATAYTIAVACCVGLLLFYVRYVFNSLASSLLFSTLTAGLYGLLYVIIQAEDFALLLGSVLVFTVLAAVMFITRDMDWYELGGSRKSGGNASASINSGTDDE
ncbi:MAG: cell envelope integrity protein CreD [Halioglobus sp.]